MTFVHLADKGQRIKVLESRLLWIVRDRPIVTTVAESQNIAQVTAAAV